jgi:hypothetical protein
MTGDELREHVAELGKAEGLFHYYECGRCGSKRAGAPVLVAPRR